MQNKMKLDAEIFDADLNENRCKFARQPYLHCVTQEAKKSSIRESVGQFLILFN